MYSPITNIRRLVNTSRSHIPEESSNSNKNFLVSSKSKNCILYIALLTVTGDL